VTRLFFIFTPQGNTMKQLLKPLALATGLALSATGALAEQTIGYQTTGPANATAHVNVRVIVPKIVILRVGAADATVPDVTFTGALNPAIALTGDSQAYTAGAIPPVWGSPTIARTNPAGADGVIAVGAWTNGSGATVTCTRGLLAGATTFATGATAAGVPGTSDITVASVVGAGNLQHPGLTLNGCDVATSTALTARTTYGGTFTYGSSLTWANLNAGTYGNTITYTATAP
jgi:hypothetical protein